MMAHRWRRFKPVAFENAYKIAQLGEQALPRLPHDPEAAE